MRRQSSTSTRPRAIGIDGGTWGNRRGYGRFLRELLPELVKARPEWQFTVFLDQPQEDTAQAPNLKWVIAYTGQSVSESAAADSARPLSDLLRMGQAVNRVKLDLLFFPTVYSYFPVVRQIPIVVGIHDTMADRFPQFAFAGKRQELLWRAKVRMALAQTSRVVTVSEYSRRNIADYFGLAADRIAVISEGPAEVFVPGVGGGDDTFVLAVGGISPNKNLAVLIRALPAWTGVRLVLVGDYSRDGFQSCYNDLVAEAHRTGVADRVQFAGYVPDGELAQLYRACSVFAMPSLEEGFGLPLVEAMACGCACVVSSGHALEEVGGEAVVLAEAASVEDWVEKVGRVLGDSSLRASLREKAIARARKYTWARGAERLANVFGELMNA